MNGGAMVLKYRASLPGIKGFARVYEVKDSTTLYSFHKQMRADMDFPQDQMVLFKAFDADGAVKARYGIFDLGAGTIDSVTIGETKGPNPIEFENGYVAFEDLPDDKKRVPTDDDPADDDDDEDDDDTVDGEGEEIYDENEDDDL